MSEQTTFTQRLLDEYFHADDHKHWLNTPRLIWAGQTAQQMLTRGQYVAVECYLIRATGWTPKILEGGADE